MSKINATFALIISLASPLTVHAQPVPGQTVPSAPSRTSTGVLDNGSPPSGGLRGALTVPVVSEPTLPELDVSNGQQWHRASMKLAGSMCPACLLELEHKLQVVPGVAFVAIKREPTAAKQTITASANQPVPGAANQPVPGAANHRASRSANQPASHSANLRAEQPGARTVPAVILYDSSTVGWAVLEQCIKEEKYKTADLSDHLVAAANDSSTTAPPKKQP